MRLKILAFALAAIVIVFDQWSKSLVRENLPEGFRRDYFHEVFVLLHSENPGAFLSFGATFSQGTRFMIFSALVILFLTCVVVLLLVKHYDRVTTIALALLLGGGVGNLIDRIKQGSVTDFLNIGFGFVRTGIFNIADVAIMMGIVLLLLRPLILRVRH